MFQNAKLARLATLGVLALMLLALALNHMGLLSSSVSPEAKLQGLAGLLPALFYVAGIWITARALKAMASGGQIEDELAKLMQQLGFCLFFGGLTFVFVQPLFLKFAIPGWTAIAWFDLPSITLGCIGLLLVYLSHQLAEARKARSELDEFV